MWVKSIETARLVLRPLRWEDFAEFHRLVYADPEVAPWWTGRTRTMDEVRDGFARKVGQTVGEPGWLAVVLQDGAALIGGMGFQRWEADEDTSWLIPEHPEDAPRRDPDMLEAELTYALGRAYWGQGYATEAGRAMLAYGFGELGVARVISSINSGNTRSVRLAQRLGCRIGKNLHPRPSRWRDTPGVIAILHRDDWLRAATIGEATGGPG
jgi:RimJ/RimL family protein N-acetyltransferase